MIIRNTAITLLALCVASPTLANDQPWFDTQLPTNERIESLIDAMTLKEKASQLVNSNVAIERLGLPEYDFWNEALHGVARNGRATVFPQAIGMAATFDQDLLLQAATVISDEARAKFNVSSEIGNRSKYSGLTFWTPNINIFRDPRWGRGQETYGEDPYLTAQMGKAMVNGLQGDHPKYLKTAAAAKHFAVHSGPEALRHEFDAIASEKDMYETYFPAFEALVTEADVETVMAAYNRVNGHPAGGSDFLLNTVLRDKWGFSGHIVSDCWGLADFHEYHKVTANAVESAALAINTGTDLNCGSVYTALPDAVEAGLVDEKTIDTRLHKVLATKFKLGFFDPKDDNPYNSISADVVNSDAHADVAYEMAVKSIVLLQNKNQVLPLDKNIRNVYVTGPFASSSEVLLGNYYGLSGKTTNILDGITANVSVGTTINYKQGILPYQANVNPIDWTTGEAKQMGDVIIAVMGLSGAYEGEEGEAIASPHKGDRLSLDLPEHQIEFLRKLRKDNDKPVIAVLTAGTPVNVTEIAQLADAIVFAWYPGQEGGKAVADILFGERSPSGRLPITFPKSEAQLPPYDDYSMQGRTYRYMTEEPMYPFGFGLSYATVKFDNITLGNTEALSSTDGQKGTLDVSVNVTNTGTRELEEVVQLYLKTPNAGIDQPIQSLKGFQRIKLAPGQTEQVSFTVSKKQLYSINAKGKPVLLEGDYHVIVGNASPGKRSEILGAAKPQIAKFVL
ncbi:glycoside hydrolase family 3 C-terminal domain-containing protein [Alteromonas sp. MMG017]|uniref:glycoside hydrolase family 3 C-terminal domain-containing protein n=1 Tax=Alteromonas sp. MMG017 TaxID=2822692 RepID=UPI001B3A6B1B|nr:glycoside hydrolase family 3 C-terminal domain-containing protein [Alteromonas sp. MMG017]MBQ4828476.1 glycoside hydrolase family 3 C-terminal domain-containing protein [Alteromonas sp. MMG017]